MTSKIGEIYNQLLDFESKTKRIKGVKQLYPVHKKLEFKEERYSDILYWLIEHLKINDNDYILDAGCGVGYVLTNICKKFNCNGLGISLSEKEIAYARNVCRELGMEKQISFARESFDEKLDMQFDIIIAIESIKHSVSVHNTLKNMVLHLKPGGRLFILDDFETDNRFQFLKKQVKKFWAVNSFYRLNSVTEILTELKLKFEVIDFTANVPYTKKHFTTVKLILMYPFLFLVMLRPFFEIYTIYFAGFCLERLYKKGALEYKAIIAAIPEES